MQYYSILQPPPDPNLQVLLQISHQLDVIINHTTFTETRRGENAPFPAQAILDASVSSPYPLMAPGPPSYIAILWFAALVCGLGAASIAMSANQWLNNLLTPTALPGKGCHEHLRIWNLRHQTFQQWRIARLLDAPSILLQIALVLFLIGIVGYLWQLDAEIATPISVLVVSFLLVLLITAFIPIFIPYTPLVSPQSKLLWWTFMHLKLGCYHLTQWLCSGVTKEHKLYQRIARIMPIDYLKDIPQVNCADGGYSSWAAAESVILGSQLGEEMDKAIVANMLPAVKDDDDSVKSMEAFLYLMGPKRALNNISTLCQRSVLTLLSDRHTTQLRGVEPENKFITMGLRFAGRFLGAGATQHSTLHKLQEQAIGVYEIVFNKTGCTRTGRSEYLQMFEFLGAGNLCDDKKRASILNLIHDHYYWQEAIKGEWPVQGWLPLS